MLIRNFWLYNKKTWILYHQHLRQVRMHFYSFLFQLMFPLEWVLTYAVGNKIFTKIKSESGFIFDQWKHVPKTVSQKELGHGLFRELPRVIAYSNLIVWNKIQTKFPCQNKYSNILENMLLENLLHSKYFISFVATLTQSFQKRSDTR